MTLSADWKALPPDPLGTVWGHFDAHGWNMAFDLAARRLNGIYDFGDSGFGPRHRDLAYAALTGLPVEPERLRILSGAHRLWELAKATDENRDWLIAAFARWGDDQ